MPPRRRARAALRERKDGKNQGGQRTEPDDSGRRRRCRQLHAYPGPGQIDRAQSQFICANS